MNKFSNCFYWVFAFSIFWGVNQTATAQTAQDYSFSQSVDTYTPLTNGTPLIAGAIDDQLYKVALPQGFSYMHRAMDSVTISTNGHISFSSASNSNSVTTTTYNVISASLTNTGGAIAAFGADLTGVTAIGSLLHYEQVGNEFVVEWKNYRRRLTTDTLNFQIRLNSTNGTIKIVYGSMSASSSTTYPVVGIRGIAATDFNNRSILEATGAWVNSVRGTLNTNTCYLNSTTATTKPAEGTTFTYAANNCISPTALSSSNPTVTGATINWTAPTNAPANGYEYYVSTTNTVPAASIVGTAVAATSVTVGSLTNNTTYYVWVRSVCSTTDFSVWSSVTSFTTLCSSTNVPYTQNFESVTTPALPSCVTTNTTSGNLWTTTTASSNKMGRYLYHSSQAANSWLYTQGINLTAGQSYRVSYKYYKSSATYAEKIKVAYGTEAIASAMTTVIATHDPVAVTALTSTYVDFVAPTTGVYYIGFNAFSAANLGTIYLDDIVVDNTPTCFEPTGLTRQNILSNSVDVSWTVPTIVPANGYEYYISTTNTAPTASTVGTAVTGTSVTIGSLTDNTTHYVWVRSVCSATDISAWSSAINFTTLCGVANIPYLIDFESVTTPTLPSCVTTVAITGNLWNTYTFNTNKVGRYSYSATQNANSWLFTKGINLTAGQSYRISYKYSVTDPLYPENLKIAYGTEGTASGMTTVLATHVGFTHSSLLHNHVDFVPTASGVYYFGFNAYSNLDMYQIIVDDILVDLSPSCFEPTGLTHQNILSNSVDVSWTVPTMVPANGYEYYVSTTNTAPTTSTVGTAVAATSVTIGSLADNTTHYVWVRSICSATDMSAWSSVSPFTTPCTATNVPYTQNFESVTTPALPSCVTTNTTSGNLWTTTTVSSNKMGRYLYHSSQAANSWLYTQGINLTAGQSYRVSYKYYKSSATYVEKIKVAYGTSNTASAMTTVIATHDPIAVTTLTSTYVDFIAPTTGVYYIGFNAFSAANLGTIYLDDIVVDLSPSCVAPTSITSSDLTATSVQLSWVAPTSGTPIGYEYYISTSSVTPASTQTGITVTNPSVGLTNLTANTAYYVWVRSVCSASDMSAWSSTATFYTGYCVPTGSTTYYISSVTTQNAIQNIAFTNTTASIYLDRSTTIITGYPGNQFNIAITPSASASQLYYMWVDWNNDLDFDDAGEAIFATTATATSYSGSVTIPSTQALGNYRVRIAVATSGGTIPVSSCASSYGRYVDFTLEVGPIPTCYAPTALLASTSTTTSAQLSWTAPVQGTPTGYEYYISTTNTAPTSATTGVTVTTTSTTVSNLTPNTTYYVWVRSVCSASDMSAWSSGATFYTGHCIPTGVTSYYLSGIRTTGALSNINFAATTGQGYRDNSTTQIVSYPGNEIVYTMTPSSGTNYFYVWVDWNNDLDFNDAGETVLATTGFTSNYTGTLTIPSTQVPGSYRIRFANSWSGNITSACGPAANGGFVDFTLEILPVPTCYSPTGLQASTSTTTSAQLSWTAPVQGTPIGYEYYISTTNTAPTSATTGVTVTTTSTTVSNLTPNTTYYVWVRSVCSASDASYWGTGATFYTGYCVPTGVTSYYLSGISTTGGSSNINFAATTGQGYRDNSATQIESYAGSQIVYTMTPSSGTNYFYVWVDWNNDLDFNDAGETVLATTNYAANYTGTLTIPSTQAAGNYRIRFANSWSGNITSACGPAANGAFVDFTLTILPQCTSPITLTTDVHHMCSGATGTITVYPTSSNTTATYDYLWSNGQTTATATGLGIGFYTVTVSDGALCSEEVTVEVLSSILSVAVGTIQGDCGAENGSAQVVGVGSNITYAWSNGQSVATATGLVADTYTVTISNNICTVVTTVDVPSINVFSIVADITDEVISAPASGAIAITSPLQDVTYVWSNGETTASITGLTTGSYSVTVTDVNGCFVVETFVVDLINSVDNVTLSLIKAYPNPTTSIVNVAGLPTDSKVMVVNNLGQIVRSFVAQNEIEQIDLSDLAPATYWIRVENQNASTVLPVIRMK